jgi:hypothetical protein
VDTCVAYLWLWSEWPYRSILGIRGLLSWTQGVGAGRGRMARVQGMGGVVWDREGGCPVRLFGRGQVARGECECETCGAVRCGACGFLSGVGAMHDARRTALISSYFITTIDGITHHT